MQKVDGSSPFSRFEKGPKRGPFPIVRRPRWRCGPRFVVPKSLQSSSGRWNARPGRRRMRSATPSHR
jgi:hypothetical protein